MTEARAVLNEAMKERELQNTVIRMAKAAGWACYHTYDSRKSEPGYPDLTLVHQNPELPIIFAELKRQKGTLGPQQAEWLEMLHRPPVVIAEVWRPSDLDRVEALLTGSAEWREAS